MDHARLNALARSIPSTLLCVRSLGVLPALLVIAGMVLIGSDRAGIALAHDERGAVPFPSLFSGEPAQQVVGVGCGPVVSGTPSAIDEGGSGTYLVFLARQPTANVTVTINDPLDDTDVTAEPATLTFSSSNWNTPQTVTVSGAEDTDNLDDTGTITHAVSSTDTVYHGAVVNNVSIKVTDNDRMDFALTGRDTATGSIREGDTGTYTIRYLDAPSEDVTVTVVDPMDNTDVTTDPETLLFTTENWNTYQTVTVTVAEDADWEDETATVTHFAESEDLAFNRSLNKEVIVNVIDNDKIDVSFASVAHTVAEGSAVSVTVSLSADPDRTVVIPITATPRCGAVTGGLLRTHNSDLQRRRHVADVHLHNHPGH